MIVHLEAFSEGIVSISFGSLCLRRARRTNESTWQLTARKWRTDLRDNIFDDERVGE